MLPLLQRAFGNRRGAAASAARRAGLETAREQFAHFLLVRQVGDRLHHPASPSPTTWSSKAWRWASGLGPSSPPVSITTRVLRAGGDPGVRSAPFHLPLRGPATHCDPYALLRHPSRYHPDLAPAQPTPGDRQTDPSPPHARGDRPASAANPVPHGRGAYLRQGTGSISTRSNIYMPFVSGHQDLRAQGSSGLYIRHGNQMVSAPARWRAEAGLLPGRYRNVPASCSRQGGRESGALATLGRGKAQRLDRACAKTCS